ncbi:hypothetical protein HanRHA438_Chr14g0636301 [Helianthus annuus]|nr:hypothetical protein HanHA89_Chr14g0544691 [Helianthus annuus]KAJ0655048.1 hypothetical protein HanLR1_Chr14g0514001 [Helianthus annuus]KAJ0658761.1 hypothetical protein HanOQP8_Chr14g0511841 [Helianthus annuus]KAJ0838966.1 hypothetical protein HanPSC8_Chr14g0601081 [Helianthus annuus]KAJ0852279.1 hypothetical protein HanRHA438_Chr14g0636301 [Helianthus annuus]
MTQRSLKDVELQEFRSTSSAKVRETNLTSKESIYRKRQVSLKVSMMI